MRVANLTRSAILVTAATLLVAPWAGDTAGAGRRPFPDTTSRIAVLTDQLPADMTEAQVRFAATHYVGTQKLTLDLSQRLRAVNPNFIVLHYRLAMWQSAPNVVYIVDGRHWSNDFPHVSQHESWFWHNPAGERVASQQDRKLLMNIGDTEFRAYWKASIVQQVDAGDYDGVFLDSASPALLQWEARNPADPRLLDDGVRSNRLPEFGNRTWIEEWQEWIADLDAFLDRLGIPLIPNVGGFATSWDNTDYSLTAGVFSEGYLDPEFAPADWVSAANETLALVRRNRIVILQNYVKSAGTVARRKYLLANYLLVKGSRTYVSYFGQALDWYPEWALDLGAPRTSATTVADLAWNGIYRRDFERGFVLVNPSMQTVTVQLGGSYHRVDPVGGGPVRREGVAQGSVSTTTLSTLDVGPRSAEILLRQDQSR